eukprot:scaffold3598_cov148-Skeletonema_dohrnii-CCMP3373.AAC.2
MADGGTNVFVYLGGEQVVPQDVTHVIIDRSVKIILRGAFQNRGRLVSLETHEGIEIIEGWALSNCISLKEIKLIGVREIQEGAFFDCIALANVDFGDKLEIIQSSAFHRCISLQKIKMPSVRTIEGEAFDGCAQLADVEFGCNLERIQQQAFYVCPSLRRITIPLKDDMIPEHDEQHRCSQFDRCPNLTTVDLVGGIHKTISSLLLERWRTEMKQEINRINQDLPERNSWFKANTIRGWIMRVIDRMEHFKAEHYRLLKEDMTQLELAVWKAKLDEKDDDNSNQKVQAKKAKIDVESARKERRITSGADIIIRNVLPFLQLFEEEE